MSTMVYMVSSDTESEQGCPWLSDSNIFWEGVCKDWAESGAFIRGLFNK